MDSSAFDYSSKSTIVGSIIKLFEKAYKNRTQRDTLYNTDFFHMRGGGEYNDPDVNSEEHAAELHV